MARSYQLLKIEDLYDFKEWLMKFNLFYWLFFFLSYRAISCFALVKLKGKEKKSNKRIAMLSEINDHIEHKHFATFMNNFPSLCVYGPLPLSISVYLLTADGVRSQ